MQDRCWMFDSVHERDFASVSDWPLKSVDQQQSQRWRAGPMRPAGHRRSSWRTAETPTGSQRTCQIKVDCPTSPVTWTTQPTVPPPLAALRVASKGRFEFCGSYRAYCTWIWRPTLIRRSHRGPGWGFSLYSGSCKVVFSFFTEIKYNQGKPPKKRILLMIFFLICVNSVKFVNTTSLKSYKSLSKVNRSCFLFFSFPSAFYLRSYM